ncbi:trypsin-like peptidase domain-containing protein [soil metagenome]
MSQETPTQQASVLAALSNDLAGAVESISPSLVTVHGRRRLSASGIVWNGDGLIVTANHVVERDDDLSITTSDDSTHEVALVGRDQGSDIALLYVEGASLSPALASGTVPKPGHMVLAVGRPGKNGAMASLGVVSLVGGEWRTSEGTSVESFVRSDAAMLPGFSGGALIDSSGNVIGMNSSTIGRRGGLTVPYDAVASVVAALKTHGKVRKGFLGIGTQSVELNSALKTSLGLDQQRALVIVSIQADGPAERSGLMIGDVLLSIDGTRLATVEELQDHLTGEIVGHQAAVSLIRGGSILENPVTVGERG